MKVTAEQLSAEHWLRRYDRRQSALRWAERVLQGVVLFGIGFFVVRAFVS